MSSAQRVKRNDFFDDESVETRNDLEDDDAILPPSYGFNYNFIDVNQSANVAPRHNIPAAPNVAQASPRPETEDKFEFRLFAPSSTTPTTQAKITLRPSPPPSGIPIADGRFVKPNRPDDYYFTSSLPEIELQTLQHQYSTTAISSAEILLGAKKSWPGTSLPWRVIHLPALTQIRQRKPSISPQKTIALVQNMKPPPPPPPPPAAEALNPNTAPTYPSTQPLPPSTRTNPQRTKPSKKRRILLRRRLKLRTKLAGEAKEQAIRDKKTAMNRKNKLRRREKERQKRRKEGEAVGEDEEKAGE